MVARPGNTIVLQNIIIIAGKSSRAQHFYALFCNGAQGRRIISLKTHILAVLPVTTIMNANAKMAKSCPLPPKWPPIFAAGESQMAARYRGCFIKNKHRPIMYQQLCNLTCFLLLFNPLKSYQGYSKLRSTILVDL